MIQNIVYFYLNVPYEADWIDLRLISHVQLIGGHFWFE